MKIISKYKDYYDYLSGIYGIDNKIVLDRRNFSKISFPELKLKLYIAGRYIEGFWVDGKILYGNDLKEYIINNDKIKYVRMNDNILTFLCDNNLYRYGRFMKFAMIPILDKENVNLNLDCPIVAKPYCSDYVKYPILKDLNLPSFIPAKDIYLWIYEWLSDKITKNEKTSDNIPNNQKIVNKGFDLKTSFRPNMK